MVGKGTAAPPAGLKSLKATLFKKLARLHLVDVHFAHGHLAPVTFGANWELKWAKKLRLISNSRDNEEVSHSPGNENTNCAQIKIGGVVQLHN